MLLSVSAKSSLDVICRNHSGMESSCKLNVRWRSDHGIALEIVY